MADLPTGTVTLLFSDIEGSTALVKRLGAGWPDMLGRHRALLRVAIEAEAGIVVDCQGDAMFAVFRSAPGAVRAARRAQAHMAREPWPDAATVRLRMGLHTGEPDRTEDGYTGIDVVHAARLCAAGHGGQVLLTETTSVLAGADTIDLGPVTLADIDGPEHVHQLTGDGPAETFPPLRTNAPVPLEGLGSGGGDHEQRIARAEQRFEQRLNEHIAGVVERALEGPLSPPRRERH
jgi:class 3 adenylate cyclase